MNARPFRRSLLSGVALTVAMLVQTSTATAQNEGFYIGAGAGLTWAEDVDFGARGSLESETGWGVLGAIGYALGNGVRLELEVGERQADIDGAGIEGRGRAWNFFGNVYYDFTAFDAEARWVPYVGVGAGLAGLDLESVDGLLGGDSVDDYDQKFGIQGIAGLGYAVTESVNLFMDYRYLTTEDMDFVSAFGNPLSSDYASHNLTLGLRYAFGSDRPKAASMPPPPPAPQPVAAPAGAVSTEAEEVYVPTSYLTFFDFDDASLTAEARGIVAAAAESAKTLGVARIKVTGHADRTGATAYNMGLSLRRAEAVRAALVADGVASSDIGITAKGEADPLVETPDGVREPQNRRVEIVLD